MKVLFFLLSVFICLVQENVLSQDLAKFVNPFVGTGGHGHTFPGATIPFGMVQLSPDTRVEGWDACAGYHYSDTSILGFSHTHLSGTGIADYGDILISPSIGQDGMKGFRHSFTHHQETATPGYYRVDLNDGIRAELTATTRVGVHRYTFPQSHSAALLIDLHHGLGPDKVLASNITILNDREISGFRRSSGWAKDQMIYFIAQFSQPFVFQKIVIGDSLISSDQTNAEGTDLKAFVEFPTASDRAIIVKVGISSVSIEGARNNIAKEMNDWDFDRTRNDARESWNMEFRKITVEGGSENQRMTLYSALYHAFIAPNVYSDADGRYRGMDGSIRHADGFDMYTVFSLWDTFRAEHPLLTIIDRKRTSHFIKSLLTRYDESGALPVWELSANETWCMIGYHAVPVIADGYMKGIRDYDLEKAYRAMKNSAMLDHFGLAAYRTHGYIPGEMESESVSKTLEYAFDDWCIARLADSLGHAGDAAIFSDRASSYRNLFDPSTRFMRPKENGAWVEPFDPKSVTVHYTEANAWQYSFFVPQDIDGLISLLGGRDRMVARLDSLFYSRSDLNGREQADITGLIGQYAQGNEPSHHVAYLYNYAGAPWKTQQVVRRIMDSLYSPEADGLCGNDDCGQMSAWYVMSAIGVYQVTPGLPEYAIGSPLFDRVSIHLENGKTFMINAHQNGSAPRYIQSATLNGDRWDKSFLTHATIEDGGTLQVRMASEPSSSWGMADIDLPHTPSARPMVTVPFVTHGQKVFSDSTEVSLATSTSGARILFSSESEVLEQMDEFHGPIQLKETDTVYAIAVKDGIRSKLMKATFTKRRRAGSIKLTNAYSPQYAGGGDEALLDGIRGATDFRLGAWQGFEENDLEAIVDLGSQKEIKAFRISCLQDIGSWIFFPTSVTIELSIDGVTFAHPVIINNPISPKDEEVQMKEFGGGYSGLRARFIKIHAKNIGHCPAWHKGAGGKAWLFADEIIFDTNPD